MKSITFIFLLLFIFGCSKNKTVYICGDHVCINKTEAKQYFEENLSLEVKIVRQNIKKEVDLVELNLRNDDKEKKISITQKEVTNKDLRILSDKEKKNIENKIKQKKKEQKNKKIVKRIHKKKTEKNYLKQTKLLNKKEKTQKSDNKSKNEIEDVCSLIKICDIDEISEYLLKIGKKKDYPDITKRQ